MVTPGKEQVIGMSGKAQAPAEDGRAAALAAIQAAEAAHGERLQGIWDGARALAQAKGGSGYQAEQMLRAEGVPQPDAHAHDGFDDGLYTVRGLQHVLEERAAAHEAELAGVARAVRAARRSRSITRDEASEFLTAHGFEPDAVTSRCTVSGTATFTVAGSPTQTTLAAALEAALRGVEGVSDVDVSRAQLRINEI